MKINTLFCYILSCIIGFISCSKKTDSPGQLTVTPKPDTLTSGWSKVVVDTSENLTDIFFVNPTTGYLAGKSCYKSINGGATWIKTMYPSNSIANLSLTPDGKLFAVNLRDSIFKTIDGGASFTSFKTNSSGISDIFFVDNNTGYAVYLNGLLQTTNGGISWTIVTPSTGLAGSGEYSSIFFINSTTGWISRGFSIYKTNGNINNWVRSSLTGSSSSGIGGIIFLYAVSSSLVYAGVSNGEIYKSIDGGIIFSKVATLSPVSQYGDVDLHFLDANNGYACAGSRIYKTADGGITWLPVVSLGTGSFVEIHFTDLNNGWGCTTGGSVLRFHQ